MNRPQVFARVLVACLAVCLLSQAVQAAPAKAGEFKFRKGMVLGLFHQSANISYRSDVDELAALGCNSISLSFVFFQDDYDSSFIYTKAGRTAPDSRIRETILYAREKGMTVMLFPYLLLENPSEGKWRGAIAPKDADAWWDSYSAQIIHYAQIAQECGVESFSVGSELSSMDTTKYDGRWRTLIREIRKVYGGMLTYTANWDHRNQGFWDELDFLSISSYFEVSETKTPTVEDLIEGWKPFKEDLDSWYAKIAKGRPMVFAEIGYPSIDGGSMYPWDYTKQEKADVEEQKLCYEAFKQVWKDCPYLGGVYFYAWFEKGGKDDRGYTPKGKPALEVIKSWYGTFEPLYATQPALQPSTNATSPSTSAAADAVASTQATRGVNE